ncbi:MAG: universal stress protein [Nitrospira sp.]|nr:universal stress protein [bacterium]MBL7048631.1 universal stress protein [Nitrospira sp.]
MGSDTLTKTAGEIATPGRITDRHLLIALDGSKNAERALMYVADFLGGQKGFRVTLLRIVPELSEDYFATQDEHDKWIDDETEKAEELLESYRGILIQSGFKPRKVGIHITIGQCSSVAECILEHQKKLQCCTVVVGRRVISRKEEFLFGSTSNRILRSEKRCALWVIE